MKYVALPMQSFQKKMILAVLPVIFLLFGCTDVQVKEERKTVTDIGANEKVSFILDRSNVKDVDEAQEIEIKIEKCIDNALKKLEPSIQSVSAGTFRKTVFPGMDYLSVPSSPESMMELLKNPEFRKRIDSMGIRYLLILQGNSVFKNVDVEFGGSGPAAVLLFIWDKQSKMSVNVLDLAKVCSAGEIKAEALGHGWFAIFGLALGFPAIAEGPACKGLGQKVASFIAGNWPKPKQ